MILHGRLVCGLRLSGSLLQPPPAVYASPLLSPQRPQLHAVHDVLRASSRSSVPSEKPKVKPSLTRAMRVLGGPTHALSQACEHQRNCLTKMAAPPVPAGVLSASADCVCWQMNPWLLLFYFLAWYGLNIGYSLMVTRASRGHYNIPFPIARIAPLNTS